jgi:tellurite resistance protein TerC
MIWIWLGFLLLILLLLALDLGVFHRHAHVVSIKEALTWSAVWVCVSLAFSVFIYFGYENHWPGMGQAPDPIDNTINSGSSAVVKYLTGYVVEESLSMDNIFVIAMLFAFFGVPRIYQHRVLFWGILGAIVLRGLMILLGAALVARFAWILYIFGGFLILTAVKMLFMDTETADPSKNIVVRWVRRFFPVTERFHGEHFVVRAGSLAAGEGRVPGEAALPDAILAKAAPGSLLLTPLALTLVMVETTDVIFAVDSIPAIFAITGDPFLVFTSNIFAILGLRSLYFALAGMIHRFKYLKAALAAVLALVGVKMLTHHWLRQLLGAHFNFYLLGVIVLILGIGVGASLLATRNGWVGTALQDE